MEKNKLAVKEINLPKRFEKIVSELNNFLSKQSIKLSGNKSVLPKSFNGILTGYSG